ncbi:MAG TPA: phytoene desaturase family protein [Anaerolineales bacterium]|nr:phytoene desaturase family protein [Anaerolineales bacterium]
MMPSVKNAPSVLIVGAGIGGIAAAAHLAQRGFDVTMLEKNARAGGRCDAFTRDGHRFDTGPTLYVMPHVYESELGHLGLSAQKVLDLQRVDPTYHLFFEGGSRLALTSDMKRLGDQVERFEVGSFQRLRSYLEEGGRFYDLAMERLVQRDFRRFSDFFHLRNLPLLFQVKAMRRHYKYAGTFFEDPRLKAAFTFQDMYMGLNPSEAPATFSLIQYSELEHGVWYPRGGMHRIVEALVEHAAAAGVRVHLNTPVQRIDVSEGRAIGVTLEDGESLKADIVLANADLPYVYDALLPQDGTAAKLARKRYSCSTISFFWGLDRTFPQLEPHMLFLSEDYLGGFRALQEGGLSDKPNLYIHTPTRLDPSLAPPDCDSLIGIVPVGHLGVNPEGDLQALRDQARDAVFERLASVGIHDVSEHIKFEVCYTPCSWRKRYNLLKGATHGLSHTLTQMAYMRPHNRHARFQNLYFVGASTHPGTGIPNALISARLAAERIIDDLGMGSR